MPVAATAAEQDEHNVKENAEGNLSQARTEAKEGGICLHKNVSFQFPHHQYLTAAALGRTTEGFCCYFDTATQQTYFVVHCERKLCFWGKLLVCRSLFLCLSAELDPSQGNFCVLSSFGR